MLRAVFNIFLIFILCITASGIPVDHEALDFSAYLPLSEDTSEVFYSIESSAPVTNPSTIKLNIKSDATIETLTNEQKNSFKLEAVKNTGEVSTFNASEFIISQQNKNDTEIVLTLDLSQGNLGLSGGDYVFNISSSSKFFSSSTIVQLDVSYRPIPPYINAINTMDKGLMNVTLYFPDSNKNYLVPLTRFVPHNRAVLRTTINNLHKGSESLGLDNPIPHIPRLQVANGVLTVYLPADLGLYNENSSDGYFALNSLVNSLTPVPGVDKVKFLVNGKESDDFFHGHSTSTFYEPSRVVPKAYLALGIEELRTLLVPVDLSTSNNTELYNDIFKVLQSSTYKDNAIVNLLATIPKDIELISASRKDDMIILNLSKEFLFTFPDREDLQKLMIDSLVFSYTSIPGINKVQILLENQAVDSFAGFKLSEPLLKPKYINPE